MTKKEQNGCVYRGLQHNEQQIGKQQEQWRREVGARAEAVCPGCAPGDEVGQNQSVNCNCGTCIAPPTRRPRAHHRVTPYLGARRQNETKMFSDHDETSPSIAAVSAPSVACSMFAVQQQKWLCRQFVDVSFNSKIKRRATEKLHCRVQTHVVTV